MLRKFVTAVEQSRNQQLARVAPTKNDARTLGRRNQADQIPALLFRNRRGFPDFNRRWRLREFRGRTTLHNIGIVNGAAAGGALTCAANATSAAPARNIVDVE